MSSVVYEGTKVNNSVHDLKALSSRFTSVASRVEGLTSAMISCKGFGHIGSGVSSTSFSGEVNSAGAELDNFVSTVRNMQVTILSYSNEDKDIQEFLDDLDRTEYKNLDLSGIESHIGVGRKISNGFKSFAASLFTAGAGVVEGVCDFVETGADLLVLGKSAVSSIFTGTYDLLTGSDLTKKMWEETKAEVSEKKVENAFNNFYNNTEFGQSIKNNAFAFDAVRGISSGIGYTTAMIGANIVTAGLASGGQMAAAGSVSALRLATTAGVMGFSSGTEDAWADGASIGKGLLYGGANGAWEATQWAIGAKINQYGGVGDRIASGIFKGGKAGATTRVVLDTVDSGLEGFVQPGLKMIYKDYAGDTFADKYQNAFQEAGGWANVRNQAILGGIMSAGSELMDARKILKSASDGKTKGDTTTPKAAGGDGTGEYRSELASEDIFEREMLEDEMAAAGNYSKHTRSNIDGGYIRTADTEFNTSTCTAIPLGSRKFTDGSYVPRNSGTGSLVHLEKYYDGRTFTALLDSKKDTLSGYSYTRYKDASQIFASHGRTFNINELKLIISHSEGNLSRIKSAITMSDPTLRGIELDKISRELADKLFPRSLTNMGANVERRVLNSLIDEYQQSNTDSWKSGKVIWEDIFTYEEALKRKGASTYSTRVAELKKIDRNGILSADLVREIASSDGYPETVLAILKKNTAYPNDRLLRMTETLCSNVFKAENAARIKGQYEIFKGNYGLAGNLIAGTNYKTAFETNTALMRAGETFSQKAKRYVYYNAIDDAIDAGLSKEAAMQQAKFMYSAAMDQVGSSSAKASAEKLFKSRVEIFGYSDGLFSQFSGTKLNRTAPPQFLYNYVDSNGYLDKTKISTAFGTYVVYKHPDSYTPIFIRPDEFNLGKSKQARAVYFLAYDSALKGKTGDSAEAARVMSKILELDKSGKSLFVYSNGGKSCSHRRLTSINLASSTVDSRDAGTIFHETGHYLFGNVLNENVPSNFGDARLRAISTLRGSGNADFVKALKSNTREVSYYSDYKAVRTLNKTLANRGYSSIDAYKSHLVNLYSAQNTSQRVSTLMKQSSTVGSMYSGSFEKTIKPNFDFADPLTCANFEISSMLNKSSDAVSRSTGSFVTVSGMIDSLTKSEDYYFYGHSREYFESAQNPLRNVYHELIADYTSLRVKGDTKSIGLLRQLFGKELMDMLEKTYQDMLK